MSVISILFIFNYFCNIKIKNAHFINVQAMIKFNFIVILLISIFLVKAGSITLTGNICNSETGEPISYACIALFEVQKGATSIVNGDFSLLIDSELYEKILYLFDQEELDVDPFLESQDPQIEYLKTLYTSMDKKTDNF